MSSVFRAKMNTNNTAVHYAAGAAGSPHTAGQFISAWRGNFVATCAGRSTVTVVRKIAPPWPPASEQTQNWSNSLTADRNQNHAKNKKQILVFGPFSWDAAKYHPAHASLPRINSVPMIVLLSYLVVVTETCCSPHGIRCASGGPGRDGGL